MMSQGILLLFLWVGTLPADKGPLPAQKVPVAIGTQYTIAKPYDWVWGEMDRMYFGSTFPPTRDTALTFYFAGPHGTRLVGATRVAYGADSLTIYLDSLTYVEFPEYDRNYRQGRRWAEHPAPEEVAAVFEREVIAVLRVGKEPERIHYLETRYVLPPQRYEPYYLYIPEPTVDYAADYASARLAVMHTQKLPDGTQERWGVDERYFKVWDHSVNMYTLNEYVRTARAHLDARYGTQDWEVHRIKDIRAYSAAMGDENRVTLVTFILWPKEQEYTVPVLRNNCVVLSDLEVAGEG